MKNIRTDMANEVLASDFKYEIDKKIQGMELKKCEVDSTLSKKIHKAPGIYYILDGIYDLSKERVIVKIVSDMLEDLLTTYSDARDILIVGLGNKMITPDSLGPLVINKIEVNKHLDVDTPFKVSAISPGVLGTTGMMSADIIKAITKAFKPDLIIAVDALACSSLDRMCHSIQMSTAGISPGAGVLQRNKELSFKTLSIPVVAVGIPTVCDLSNIIDIDENYFVTPKEIDKQMDIMSMILAKSINRALSKNSF